MSANFIQFDAAVRYSNLFIKTIHRKSPELAGYYSALLQDIINACNKKFNPNGGHY